MQSFKQYITEELPPGVVEDKVNTPEEAKVFTELAEMQRAEPEQMMLKFQKTSGGGLLDSMLEHGGDLIHRMTVGAEYGRFGYDEVKEKANRLSRQLEGNPLEEIKQNIRNNAEFKERDVEEFKNELMKILGAYSEAHNKLPVYNEMHDYANNFAINIGRLKLDDAKNNLKLINNKLKDIEQYNDAASTIYKKENGQIIQYDISFRL